jgi:vacuolar-type H+-ATPase subunit F/Vma7
MTIAMLGLEDEVRGFALAGVQTTVCHGPAEAGFALDRIDRDGNVALLVVSRAIAEALPARIERLRNRMEPPIVIVLEDGRTRGREDESARRGGAAPRITDERSHGGAPD